MEHILFRYGLLLICTCGLLSMPAFAKDGTSVYFKIGLTGKIYKQLNFRIEEEMRPDHDLRGNRWFLTTGELNYRPHKRLRMGAGYMFLYKTLEGNETRHRYYLYASGNLPLGNFRIALRERFQSTYKRNGNHPGNYLRTMLTLSYRIRQTAWTPFYYTEVYNNVGHNGQMRADKIRFSAGCDYNIDLYNVLQLYYRYNILRIQDPINHQQVIGISYTHHF